MVYQGKELPTGFSEVDDGKSKVGNSYRHYSHPTSTSGPQAIKQLKRAKPALVSLGLRAAKIADACRKFDPTLETSKKVHISEKGLQRLLKLVIKAMTAAEGVPSALTHSIRFQLEDAYFKLTTICRTTSSTLSPVCYETELLNGMLTDLLLKARAWQQEVQKIENQLEQQLAALEAEKVQKKREKALFEVAKPKTLNTFFETAKDRGWKVEGPKPEEESPTVEDPQTGFEASSDALAHLQQSKQSLLPESTLVGIVRFPVIFSQGEGIFSERFLSTLVEPTYRFDVHRIYGSYLIMGNALLLGIKQEIAGTVHIRSNPSRNVPEFWISATEGKPTSVGISGQGRGIWYYAALQPYLCREYSSVVGLLERVKPVNPPIKMRQHYYYLLFPNEVVGDSSFSVGSWTFHTK